MIVGIIGSRRRDHPKDYMLLLEKLEELEQEEEISKVVTGDCEQGGDLFARVWSDVNNKECDVKYKIHPGTKKRWIDAKNSGFVNYFTFCIMCYNRNEEIAKEPLNYLVAIVASDRKGGTESTIGYFKKHHKDWEKKLILI